MAKRNCNFQTAPCPSSDQQFFCFSFTANMPKVPAESTLESDASVAKIMANRAHSCKYAVQQYSRTTRAMLVTIESILKTLKKVMMLSVSFYKQVESQWISLKQTSEVCYASQNHQVWVFEALLSKFTEPQDELDLIREDIEVIKKWTEAKEMSERELHRNNQGIEQFKKLICDVVETDRFYAFLENFRKDADNQTLFNIISTYTANIEEIYQLFRKDKHQRRLSYADEQRHAFDKKKLVGLCEKGSEVTDEALGKRSDLHGQLVQWLNEVDRCYEEAENFNASFIGQTERTEAHRLALQKFQEQCKLKSQVIVQQLQKLIPTPSSAQAKVEPPAAAAAAAANGNIKQEITDGVIQSLGHELDALSDITKTSLSTARNNTQQFESLLTSLIKHYESINEHLMKNVKQLEDTVRDDSNAVTPP